MLFARNKTKQQIPNWPWQKIATAVLGDNYELSLTFIGDTLSQKLNQRYRHKNKPANVLAFSLDKRGGDIFLNPHAAKLEAAYFDHSPKEHLLFLFIHGLLHLKGLDHGSTMERKERELFSRFVSHQ